MSSTRLGLRDLQIHSLAIDPVKCSGGKRLPSWITLLLCITALGLCVLALAVFSPPTVSGALSLTPPSGARGPAGPSGSESNCSVTGFCPSAAGTETVTYITTPVLNGVLSSDYRGDVMSNGGFMQAYPGYSQLNLAVTTTGTLVTVSAPAFFIPFFMNGGYVATGDIDLPSAPNGIMTKFVMLSMTSGSEPSLDSPWDDRNTVMGIAQLMPVETAGSGWYIQYSVLQSYDYLFGPFLPEKAWTYGVATGTWFNPVSFTWDSGTSAACTGSPLASSITC